MSTEHITPDGQGSAPAALAQAVAEIEHHVQEAGWDQQPRLYALAPTGDLLQREPDLADRLGLEHEQVSDDSLTPIEQDITDRSLEDLLPSISWPDTVRGCALAVERIVLPPGSEDEVPEDSDEANNWALNHPERTDVRIIVGVLRDGSRLSAVRVRGHEEDGDLIQDAEISPELGNALADTLA